MKNLVIVESPTKARTLARFLGVDYQIEATLGHIRDLPEKKLGIDIENNFKPEYVIVPKRREEISQIQEKAKLATKIILATDPDREGEAIAWHVMEILTIENRGLKIGVEDRESKVEKESQPSVIHHLPSFQRIVFHEITEQAIKEALTSPRTIDMNLVDAQQARRVLDRLVGYKLSPLLWRKIRRGLSAGRVQSVAVRLIVEREREIEAFKPEEYWKIEAELEKCQMSNVKCQMFLATLVEKNGEKIKIGNENEAEKIVKELDGLVYKVKEIRTEEVKKYPYPPFTTSTLQQAAANLFGWTSKRTMQVAQNLYEQGLITYHRTDSVNLAAQAINACRDFIEKEYGKNYLPATPKIYKTKSKVAQEAHEAIRPTKVTLQFEAGRDEKRLYDLIWKRFIACQMREAIYEETKIDIEAKSEQNGQTAVGQVCAVYLFRAVGRKLKFEGWKKVYINEKLKIKNEKLETENEKIESVGEKELPVLEVGELLKLLRLLPSQHFSEPPPRYTEATLIKALEEKGIGRPSTYAPIISTIQERQYVEKIDLPAGRQGRKFAPTVLGTTVNDFLVSNFSDIVDVSFTVKMEDELDEIANGKMKWVPVIAEFYEPFEKTLEKVGKEAERVKVPVEKTDQICEKCGAEMVIRIGKYGKFLACSKFPECKFTRPYINKTGLICPNCGGEIIIKKTKRGRQFYGCINYPTCNFAAWRKEEILKGKFPKY